MAKFDSIKQARGILVKNERNLRKVAGFITLNALDTVRSGEGRRDGG